MVGTSFFFDGRPYAENFNEYFNAANALELVSRKERIRLSSRHTLSHVQKLILLCVLNESRKLNVSLLSETVLSDNFLGFVKEEIDANPELDILGFSRNVARAFEMRRRSKDSAFQNFRQYEKANLRGHISFVNQSFIWVILKKGLLFRIRELQKHVNALELLADKLEIPVSKAPVAPINVINENSTHQNLHIRVLSLHSTFFEMVCVKMDFLVMHAKLYMHMKGLEDLADKLEGRKADSHLKPAPIMVEPISTNGRRRLVERNSSAHNNPFLQPAARPATRI